MLYKFLYFNAAVSSHFSMLRLNSFKAILIQICSIAPLTTYSRHMFHPLMPWPNTTWSYTTRTSLIALLTVVQDKVFLYKVKCALYSAAALLLTIYIFSLSSLTTVIIITTVFIVFETVII